MLGLSIEKKTLLVLGGSLGARSINYAVKKNIETLVENDIQIIWQTGKNYFKEYKNLNSDMVEVLDFKPFNYEIPVFIENRGGEHNVAL